MSLLAQHSVVESFKFNGKNVQSLHVKVEECFMSRDVYMTFGYEEENGKKAIQNLVPSKYKLRFGDVKPSLNHGEAIFSLHKDTALLKEPGLYCFLLRCKKDEARPFMKWVVERVLPQEVQKLTSAIEEKDNQIQPLESTNEKHQQKILRLNEDHQQAIEEKDTTIALLNDDLKNREHDNVALQAQRDVYKEQLQKCQDIITHLRTRYVDHAKDPGKDNIVMIIEKNTTPKEDEFYEYPYYVARIQ